MTKEQSNYIKTVACITMLIDHIGVILLPQYLVLRIIGRIAFPLFAYQVGIGYVHTRNKKRYILRLSVFAVAIQLAYLFAALVLKMPVPINNFNIFFTLFLGLLAIHCFSTSQYIPLAAIFALSVALEFFGIKVDYGTYGVALILALYMARENPVTLCAALLVTTLAYCLYRDHYTQMFCLMSLPFVLYPFSIKIKIPGMAFYLFYPLHLAALYAINMII